ncbi:MAG: 30S ribosomal protein S5 [Patescibacteria group bacterium]
MQNNQRNRFDATPSEFEEQVVQVNRVSKKTKGGNKVGFSALTVVGDKKGRVGVGLGKAPDVASAIRKGISTAKKHLIVVPLQHGTIPFRIDIKLGAAKVMLKPAPPGSGIIAGGAVRAVVSAAGIQNISSKVLGTENKLSNIYATLEALKRVSDQVDRKKQRSEKIA